ncbi:uncharacterized protein Z519_02805 [Cladophialophora bantiana CBS 173.52]|uniref:Uncharacterized protein n=1 Tax=Cladophialophora bantiana (strain ATCC 10958 / CBS 173.52 / CDC B-1940 / NIH 8579) TaxID=1442370 RepID=A0A0D2GGD1_CLAB1|nr:uncharacterized protein Z519_02805 [Cladophialophora bantiana CBS 173.52]KIW97412.1 hypothetical protein Z519_02805 [Cladophialophora bantiana CBS 173.52]
MSFSISEISANVEEHLRKYLRDIVQEDWEQRLFAEEIKSADESGRLTILAAIFPPLSSLTKLLSVGKA